MPLDFDETPGDFFPDFDGVPLRLPVLDGVLAAFYFFDFPAAPPFPFGAFVFFFPAAFFFVF